MRVYLSIGVASVMDFIIAVVEYMIRGSQSGTLPLRIGRGYIR